MNFYYVDTISATYFEALADLHAASLLRLDFGDVAKPEWTDAMTHALLAADDLRKAYGIDALEQPLFNELLVAHLGVCELLSDASIVERERRRMSQ